MNAVKRKGPDPSYAAAGDLMRVLCIGLIGWYHIWQQSWLPPTLSVGGFRLDLMPWVRTGYMFVDLMLVLSGFLVYLPYANGQARTPKEFYLRRALRILPSYWLCLIVMLALELTSPDFTAPDRLIRDVLAHLGFVHNLWGFSYNATRLNAVLWTLAVEVQFYLIVPVLAPVFRKRPVVTWAAMTGAGLSFIYIWTLPMAETTLFVNRLPNMLVVYANGMLAAHVYARLARLEKGRMWIALAGTVVCAASVLGIVLMLRTQSYASGYDLIRAGQLKWRWPLSACGAAFLLGGSLSFGPVRAAMSNPVTRFLAGISYNFYIWHQWIAVRLKMWRIPPYTTPENPNFAGEMPWMLHYTLLCFAAALAAATLITCLVERPCARLGRKWMQRLGKRQ